MQAARHQFALWGVQQGFSQSFLSSTQYQDRAWHSITCEGTLRIGISSLFSTKDAMGMTYAHFGDQPSPDRERR